VGRTSRRVVLGCTALLTLAGGGVGALAPGWRDPTVAAPALSSRTTSPPESGACTLVGHVTTRRGWHAPIRTDGGADGPGELSVAIPPVVLVRVQGRRLVVTTNTGERPQVRDTFYVVTGGQAVLAGAGVRRKVLAACSEVSGSR
jgi:hypothetical protein